MSAPWKSSSGERPSWLLTQPEDQYHAETGPLLSSGLLGHFLACPKTYRALVDNDMAGPNSSAFSAGSAAHTLVLEGRSVFEQRYVVGGPINPATDKPYGANTKKFSEAKAAALSSGKELISEDDAGVANMAHQSVMSHPEARRLLQGGFSEGVIKADFVQGIPAHSRIDYLVPGVRICDLKTTRQLDKFEDSIEEFGYVDQMAFYRHMVYLASGCRLPVYVVAAEKSKPNRCGVWRFADTLLDHHTNLLIAAAENLRDRLETDDFSDHYQQVRIYRGRKAA